MATDEEHSDTPTSLADRAITVARRHRAIDPRAFADRDTIPSSWHRRAITTTRLAVALGVGVECVIVRDDPERHYGIGARTSPGDLIEVTSDGRPWYFIPDVTGFVMWSWLLLGPCPDCEAPRVPVTPSRRPRRATSTSTPSPNTTSLTPHPSNFTATPPTAPTTSTPPPRRTPHGTTKGSPVMTTTPTSPIDKPARIFKNDRIALAAIEIATALPGHWTVGRGRGDNEVADVRCLSTGIGLGFHPVQEPGAWRYTLVPGPVPYDIRDVFTWQYSDEYPAATFTVGAPATEVATHIQQKLIPALHQWIDHARATQRERTEAQRRVHEARKQITTQLESEFPPEFEPVSVYHLDDDHVSLRLTMSVDDALTRIPALAQALRADDATTAPSTPTETRETK
ncbi:hypothetical protein ACFQ05_26445 [Amycolatopsis umgeniensis]|uniref:Uncharacterized protein n=1 Tax=Amycolatopsis umgeniensis TaxID=336628 RepID=A0A841BCX6_9PSEU|nr:hypothetical protein [Amycolatopsis umgeniensis]MBB5856422.1 hypothetical protein [Amycolatopsis umgeniensis]